MATLDPSTSNLHLLQTERYWNVVRIVLSKVFNKEHNLANDLQNELTQLSSEEQYLFYHIEPLYVAADLAEYKGPLDDDPRLLDYLELAQQMGLK